MSIFLVVVIGLVVLFIISKLGDFALDKGWFVVFLILSIIVGGLFLVLRKGAEDAVEAPYEPARQVQYTP
jgi:uncharacterized membrane protein